MQLKEGSWYYSFKSIQEIYICDIFLYMNLLKYKDVKFFITLDRQGVISESLKNQYSSFNENVFIEQFWRETKSIHNNIKPLLFSSSDTFRSFLSRSMSFIQ